MIIIVGDIKIDTKNHEMHVPGIPPKLIEHYKMSPFDYRDTDIATATIYVNAENVDFYIIDRQGNRIPPLRDNTEHLNPADDWEDEFYGREPEENVIETIRSHRFIAEIAKMNPQRIAKVVLPPKDSTLVEIEIYTAIPGNFPPLP